MFNAGYFNNKFSNLIVTYIDIIYDMFIFKGGFFFNIFFLFMLY